MSQSVLHIAKSTDEKGFSYEAGSHGLGRRGGDARCGVGWPSASAAGGGTGIGAVLTDANPPVVISVALGNVNGVALGVGGTTGSAKATKDGNSYKITGTASGADLSNPMAGPVTKPFEIDVTCP